MAGTIRSSWHDAIMIAVRPAFGIAFRKASSDKMEIRAG